MTVCTRKRYRMLSHIREGEVHLTEIGKVVAACWEGIPDHCFGVRLDRWVVMPDHIHGIVLLDQPEISLGRIVGLFKAACTRRTHGAESIWQRGFNDRIIRDNHELDRIRWYIDQNPSRWME